MRILENKEVKKLLMISIFIIILATIVSSIFNMQKTRTYQKEIDATVYLLIQQIKDAYPDAKEEEIIKVLNNKESKTFNKDILKRYGITEDETLIKTLEKQEKAMIKNNSMIIASTGLLLLIVFYLYLRYRQRKINEITDYVERVSNKDYTLGIEENSEDELNKLKSELYKITVMLKEQAEQSIEQKEALAASVSDISHQLKTPLTSVLILLDNLEQNENMNQATRERFITEIARQIEGINWLVISLLKLSRLDAGVVDFESKDIYLKDLLLEVSSNLEIMAEIKEVEISLECNNKIKIRGDYNWNKEAIQNIVKNAIEHTKNKTKVKIIVEENSVYTQVLIKDEGEGINQEDLKHIFDRFYKAKNTSENSFGIGLSLSKTIIEKQNGYIEVESKEGKGTIFKIKYIKQ